jgi:tRNA 5-methylaminomethyl-2-thiouridine biosynthesis bifunctional protein
VGSIVDEKATLKAYPYISHGTKVPASKYKLIKNLYFHGALGSRGFVYAPYNAKLLTELILKDIAIDERLSPVRLFKKWATAN